MNDEKGTKTTIHSLMQFLDAYENGATSRYEQTPGTPTNSSDKENYKPNEINSSSSSNQFIWDQVPVVYKESTENVRTKLKQMQADLKKKTQQMNDLQSTLARKRLAGQIKVKKLREEWNTRIEDVKQSISKKEERLKESIGRYRKEVDNLKAKQRKMESAITNLEYSFPSKIREIEAGHLLEVKRQQEKWKQEEKKRLIKKGKDESGIMKKEAAKALEPELKKIIEEHNDNRSRIQSDTDLKIKELRSRLSIEYEDKLKSQKATVDDFASKKLEETDLYYKSNMKQLRTKLERKLREVETASKKDQDEFIESSKGRLNEKRIQYDDMENKYEMDCARDLLLLRKELDESLEQSKFKYECDLSSQKKDFAAKREEWVEQESSKLKHRFEALYQESLNKMKSKHADEIELVKRKLDQKLKEKKEQNRKKLEEELSSLEDKYKLLLRNSTMKHKAVKEELTTISIEEEELKKMLQSEHEQLSQMIHDAIEHEEELEKVTQEQSKKEEALNAKVETRLKDVNQLKAKVQNLVKAKNEVQRKATEEQEILSIEMQSLKNEYDRERSTAEAKIKQIIESKNEDIRKKQQVLLSLKDKYMQFSDRLKKLKEDEILK
ncbi:predicted protein [Chaetoceros tenuissimus]|uniref:Uncharacterized protein n=1 Tax=Chaetoceros tenuissimus TaxID=426638 RepID=A0AAD3CZI0_9STRA|nr:predicted protein [Chaetoceros tenuissimus]